MIIYYARVRNRPGPVFRARARSPNGSAVVGERVAGCGPRTLLLRMRYGREGSSCCRVAVRKLIRATSDKKRTARTFNVPDT